MAASQQHQRAGIRRTRRLNTILATLLVVAVTTAGLAVHANHQAQAQTRLASSRQLAAQADRLVDHQPDLAILAGLESLSLARGQRPQPPAGLITGLIRVTHASRLLTGHTRSVNRVVFSPDGRLLVTTSTDKTVRLWEMPSGHPHGPPLTGHTNAVNAVAFSPDGRLLATAGMDHTVQLWNPGFTSWLETGCKLVNRNLSLAEWNQLAPDLPYERTCPDLPSGPDAPSNAPAARYQREQP